jgi:hypothetical protein
MWLSGRGVASHVQGPGFNLHTTKKKKEENTQQNKFRYDRSLDAMSLKTNIGRSL